MWPACDVFVIGGGINGCGVACEAADRDYSVILGETQDLAGATSSKATMLIHGGLRDLEPYAFRLAREAEQVDRLTGVKGAPWTALPIPSNATSYDDLGECFGRDLHPAEVERERAMTAEDVQWRRTKLGLHLSDSERWRVTEWRRDRVAARAPEET